MALRALHDNDRTSFVRHLRDEPPLLGARFVWFQTELVGTATLNDRESLIALLELEPALLHRQPPPSQAIRMKFLIDRGIDLTIKDYRWNSTARGWALFGGNDPTMAQWLEDADRERRGTP